MFSGQSCDFGFGSQGVESFDTADKVAGYLFAASIGVQPGKMRRFFINSRVHPVEPFGLPSSRQLE